MRQQKASGSEASKKLANAVDGRDTTLSKPSKPSGKRAPNGERASTVTVSASSTHLPSKKGQEEDRVTCMICQQNLLVTEFSKRKLKKLRKAKAKGSAMQIGCTSCTMSDVSNKKPNGDLASKSNASATATDLASKKGHTDMPKKKAKRERAAKHVGSKAKVVLKKTSIVSKLMDVHTYLTRILDITHS